MNKPEIADRIESVPSDEQVVIEFEWDTDADQFCEWWQQEGWERFKAWSEDRL